MEDTMEKKSFVMYTSYEEPINMLSDEQAGQLMKGVFTYVRTGEKISTDPMVTMLLSIIANQLDLDSRKYAESRERRIAAARKAGRASAEKRTLQRETTAQQEAAQEQDTELFAENEEPEATCVDQTQRFQPVYVDDNVNVDVYVDADDNVDVDDTDTDADADIDIFKTCRRRHRQVEECAREEYNKPYISIKYSKNAADRPESAQNRTSAPRIIRHWQQKDSDWSDDADAG